MFGLVYQTVNEEISVVGVFKKGQFRPVKFAWQNQVYNINQITLQFQAGSAIQPVLNFSIIANQNLYRLRYEVLVQKWILDEVWLEGA